MVNLDPSWILTEDRSKPSKDRPKIKSTTRTHSEEVPGSEDHPPLPDYRVNHGNDSSQTVGWSASFGGSDDLHLDGPMDVHAILMPSSPHPKMNLCTSGLKSSTFIHFGDEMLPEKMLPSDLA